MALRSASRCSELAYLDTSSMKCLPDGIKFTLTRHKNREPLHQAWACFFPIYKENPDLCTVQCLKCYIQKTKYLKTKENRLFRGLIKPFFDPTSPATISRNLTKAVDLSGGPNSKVYCRLGQSNKALVSCRQTRAYLC